MPRINIPPVTRILLIVLVAQSFLSAVIRYRQWTAAQSTIVIPYLNLIPQLSLIYPWTFFTTTLVESNVFTFAISFLTLYHCGRYLERAWSSKEFGKFLLIASLVPNVLCFLAMVFMFTLTRNESWTLSVISGTLPLQISFLVAFSQLVPAHTVTLFRGILSLRVPRLPLLYVGFVAALSLTPLLTAASSVLAVAGFLASWTYLRFYKTVFPDLEAATGTTGAGALRGDASDTFALAEFFPGPAKPFVAALAERVFDVLVSLRLCVPFSAADVSLAAARGDAGGAFLAATRGGGGPGSARAEAERRRALALKALDQRLHAATAGSSASASVTRQANSTTPPPTQAPVPVTTGPTVHTQPQADAQASMTSQPGGMLGETSYNTDGDSEKGTA